MNRQQLILSVKQFDKFFPFYLLLDDQLIVQSFGKSLGEVCATLRPDHGFSDFFVLKQPKVATVAFPQLKALQGQKILIAYLNDNNIVLQGQFELLEDTNNLLFIGEPLATDKSLSFSDFSADHHEAADIYNIALFPMQNPDPVIRVNEEGDVLLLNPSASLLKKIEFDGKVFTQKDFWNYIIPRTNKEQGSFVNEVVSNHKTYSFFCQYVEAEKYFHIYGRDVTLQKNIQQALQESIHTFRTLAESIPGVVYKRRENYDGTSVLEYVSPKLREIFGIEMDQISNYIHPEDKERWIRSIEESRSLDVAWSFEGRLIYPDNSIKWCYVISKKTAEDEKGKVYTGFLQDVTYQRQAQEELQRLSLVASTNESGVLITNTDGKVFWTNEGFSKLTGYTTAEIIGKTPLELSKGALSNREVVQNMVNAFYEGKSFNVEIVHYRKDGTWFWGRTKGQPILDSSGKVIQYFSITEDISTEKKQAEQIQRLSLVASANSKGVVILNSDESYAWVNPSFEKMTGYNSTDIIGHDFIHLFCGPLTDPEVKNRISESLKNYKSFSEELIYYRKDGTWFWARLNRQFVFDKNGKLIEKFSILEDITQEKETNEKRKEYEIKLKAAVSKLGDNLWEYDFQTGKIYLSNTENEILGYNGNEFAHDPNLWSDSIVKEDQWKLKEIFEQYEKGEIDHHTTEYRIKHKDGSTRWVLDRGLIIEKTVKEKPLKAIGTHTDITSIKLTEEALRESEQRWQFALEGSGDGVWEFNFETQKVFYSKQYKQMLGYSDDEFKNEREEWYKRIHPEDLPIVLANDEDYKTGVKAHHHIEYRMKRKQGDYVWILDRGMIINSVGSNKSSRIIGTHTDITKIKQTEIALEQRVKQFQGLSENIPGVIHEYEFRKDGTEGFRYISPAVKKIFGIEVEDFYNFSKYVHPEDVERIRILDKHAQETLGSYYDESRLIIPGRGLVWRSVSSSFSYITEEGSIVFTGFMLDITERKNVEESLRKKEEKYRGMIANMNLGLLEVDADENILYANQSFCDMSGYFIDDLIGTKASSLFVRGENAKMMEGKNEMRKEDISDAYELAVKNKRGELKWWLISAAPRYDDKGDRVGSIGIHLDITKQKEMEHQLIKAKQLADKSTQAKEIFLANMSHEIRTPMNAIMGMSGQLAKTKLDTKQLFYLDTINTAAENLVIIINDILDLSKIEAGKLSLENIGFNPKEVVNRAIHVLMHRAEEKGISITNSIYDNKLSHVLVGDPYRLNQILLNLISNAIKFTVRGSVDITCSLLHDSEKTQTVLITVKDTGIGMEEEFVNNIFEKFTQEDTSITRQYGGTGLGLSICKELIALMGGQINVSSKKGIGTSVSTIIEFAKGTAADIRQKETITVDTNILTGKKILIVDDNDMNRLVAITILNSYGAVTSEAINGKEAVDLLKTNYYDLVLMDIQMPVMDGMEAARVIRKEISPSLPLIALTANAIKGDNEKCMEAGMNDYLSKPFKEEHLLKVVAEWLGKKVILHGVEKKEENSDTQALYDLSKLVMISRGDKKFIKKMIGLFIDQVPMGISEIKSAYTASDFSKIKSIAHRIKPSIDNMGILSIKNEIREIESLAAENKSNSNMYELIQTVDKVINQVVDLLKNEI